MLYSSESCTYHTVYSSQQTVLLADELVGAGAVESHPAARLVVVQHLEAHTQTSSRRLILQPVHVGLRREHRFAVFFVCEREALQRRLSN